MSLSNRFSDDVYAVWAFSYTCHECGENGADCLHHIISPSNKEYIKGEHNTSVLNSAPLCNFKCHLYSSELHKNYKTKEYLEKTITFLVKEDYKLNENDIKFFNTYRKLYEK